ncbi:MAG: hypothetical protein JXA30_18955 [Deltaproteobacteria bacterium]|nr:hypothetical protein [Deltaproteobacteria bacterium]
MDRIDSRYTLRVGMISCFIAVVVACSTSDEDDQENADREIEAGVGSKNGDSMTSKTTTSDSGSADCIEVGGLCRENTECCFSRCEEGLCLGPTGMCSKNGAECSASAECCSGRCESLSDGLQRVCVAASETCRVGGESCESDGDCCSGTCGSDGFCPIMRQCQTAGEPCTGFHECCSGTCADPGSGTRVCQYVNGCRPIGEVCLSDDNCCSALCRPYGDTGINRCIKPAGCMAPGEVCWTGQSANCCPQGATGGLRLCKPTFLGVSRCFTKGTTTECLPDGQTCTMADECCSQLCLPDADGNLVCGPNCVPLQGACTADADCCEGRCIKGSCHPNDSECQPLGGYCDTPEDCCADFCDTAIHRCSVTII